MANFTIGQIRELLSFSDTGLIDRKALQDFLDSAKSRWLGSLFDKAIETAQKAITEIKVNTDRHRAQSNFAIALANAGRIDKAIAVATQLTLHWCEREEAMIWIIRALAKAGQIHEAALRVNEETEADSGLLWRLRALAVLSEFEPAYIEPLRVETGRILEAAAKKDWLPSPFDAEHGLTIYISVLVRHNQGATAEGHTQRLKEDFWRGFALTFIARKTGLQSDLALARTAIKKFGWYSDRCQAYAELWATAGSQEDLQSAIQEAEALMPKNEIRFEHLQRTIYALGKIKRFAQAKKLIQRKTGSGSFLQSLAFAALARVSRKVQNFREACEAASEPGGTPLEKALSWTAIAEAVTGMVPDLIDDRY